MQLLLKSFFLLCLTFINTAFASYDFFHGDPVRCTNIQTTMTGDYQNGTWTAKDIKQQDKPFLASLYANEHVMRYLGDGKIRTEQHAKDRINILTARNNTGLPYGGWIASDDNQKLGFLVAAPHSSPGWSEISYIVSPDHQQKGIGKSFTQTLVQYWAPKVREIGEKHDQSALCKKFSCFGDQPLSVLYATASPVNVP